MEAMAAAGWGGFSGRMIVRGWIEESTGTALSLADTSPDTLIAEAQSRGMTPWELRAWIFAHAHTGELTLSE